MSNSPRTDAEIERIASERETRFGVVDFMELSDFARTLERELAGANENYHNTRLQYDKLWDESKAIVNERDSLRTQLEKAQAEIARMTECNQASIICLVTWMQSKQPHPKDIETALKFCNQAIAAKE